MIPAWRQKRLDAEQDRREQRNQERLAALFNLEDREDDAQLVQCRVCKAFIPQKDFPAENRARAYWRCASCESTEVWNRR